MVEVESFFVRHAGVLDQADRDLLLSLEREGQDHLFEGWDEVSEGKRREFLRSLQVVDRSYPGGIVSYLRNARRLLAEAAADRNALEGCIPYPPEVVDLTDFGDDYEDFEELGLKVFAETGVVLVAGGLGERLGYHGIKLGIPFEVACGTTYLEHYAGVIAAASRRLGCAIPLVIMTSRDTHEPTLALLAEKGRFGLGEEQVILLRQELVPALADLEGRLALDGPCQLVMKPHGHGDIHTLLHLSGVARGLARSGVRYLLFIQDTNAQSFNAAFAALGVTERRGYDFNSVAVKRIPGEAAGGIVRLVRKGSPDITVNVEYNQLDALLRETVDPRGDVGDGQGYSIYPGNINVLVVRMEPYLKVLERTKGVVAEFVNPKFADASRKTFKKPARLETLMQDLPKLFQDGEKVGVTVFDRRWCFSACKNSLDEAGRRVAGGGVPESASSAESDFYWAGRRKLEMAGVLVKECPTVDVWGVKVCPGPRVVLRPSFALTLADVKSRVRGGEISGEATVVLEGDVKVGYLRVGDGGAVRISAGPGSEFELEAVEVTDEGGPRLKPLSPEEMASSEVPEYLRIRGYRIQPGESCHYHVDMPGSWKFSRDGAIRRIF